MYFIRFKNANSNYEDQPILYENTIATPITFNDSLKQKLTSFAIITVYITLLIEYIINPHSIYNGIIMPPCVVLETYIAYNIFIIGVPLAIF